MNKANSNILTNLETIAENEKNKEKKLNQALEPVPRTLESTFIDGEDLNKYYQGSLMLNFSNKNMTPDKINLNVVNNFLISNSSVTQYIGEKFNATKNCSLDNHINQMLNNTDIEEFKKKLEKLKKKCSEEKTNIIKDFESKIKEMKENILKEKLDLEEAIKQYKNKKENEIQQLKNQLNIEKIKVQTLQNTCNLTTSQINTPPITSPTITIPSIQPTITTNTPTINNPPSTTYPPLACLNTSSLEFHHFVMNYQTCENLNEDYLTIAPQMRSESSRVTIKNIYLSLLKLTVMMIHANSKFS